MNREIKFRAWDKKYHKMIFTGFHLLGEVMAFSQIEQYLFKTKKTDNVPTIERWNDIELMQFTGLKDKNGKEIYEGDIITSKLYPFQDNYCHDIYFNEAEFRVRWTMFRLSEMFEHANHNVEVIGNIYENPELLNT